MNFGLRRKPMRVRGGGMGEDKKVLYDAQYSPEIFKTGLLSPNLTKS